MFMPVLASALLDPPFYRKRGFARKAMRNRPTDAASVRENQPRPQLPVGSCAASSFFARNARILRVYAPVLLLQCF